LTGKTTNAKAKPEAPTPLEGGKSQKKQQGAVRPARHRISISEQVKPVLKDEDDVPEIEYMPPAPERRFAYSQPGILL
jgi:hypothetical protein